MEERQELKAVIEQAAQDMEAMKRRCLNPGEQLGIMALAGYLRGLEVARGRMQPLDTRFISRYSVDQIVRGDAVAKGNQR